MIKLINKLLSYINLQLVSTKPVSMVEETVKFLNTVPKGALCDGDMTGYIGDINYTQEIVKGEFPQVSGKTYIQQKGTETKYFCDFENE